MLGVQIPNQLRGIKQLSQILKSQVYFSGSFEQLEIITKNWVHAISYFCDLIQNSGSMELSTRVK